MIPASDWISERLAISSLYHLLLSSQDCVESPWLLSKCEFGRIVSLGFISLEGRLANNLSGSLSGISILDFLFVHEVFQATRESQIEFLFDAVFHDKDHIFGINALVTNQGVQLFIEIRDNNSSVDPL